MVSQMFKTRKFDTNYSFRCHLTKHLKNMERFTEEHVSLYNEKLENIELFKITFVRMQNILHNLHKRFHISYKNETILTYCIDLIFFLFYIS